MIPKIIHQTYPTKILPQILEANRHRLMRLNPGWEVKFYSDSEVDDFIYWRYPYVYEYYLKLNHSYGAARADFFRYIVLYTEGGVYLDVKSAATRPLNEVIDRNIDFYLNQWPVECDWGQHPEVLSLGLRCEFSNWFIAAKRGHKFLEAVLNRIMFNIINYDEQTMGVGKLGVLRTTGPIAYTQAIFPLMKRHPVHLVLQDARSLGLEYTVFSDEHGHKRLFDPHYSKLTSPVVLR